MWAEKLSGVTCTSHDIITFCGTFQPSFMYFQNSRGMKEQLQEILSLLEYLLSTEHVLLN